ncbi:glucose inhibited division protein a [Holotrichia oblita]|nr:glucose inhibited division protein a [Holotrichia oblita]
MMKNNAEKANIYDCVVIGAGHAGCEAALCCARLGTKTLVLATSLDTVAFLACNPSIGGTAKGQIVKEIDALGGQMGINADSSLIQLRMLNRGKGAAVHSPRAQVDKYKYHISMKRVLEGTNGLTLRQGEAVNIERVHVAEFCRNENDEKNIDELKANGETLNGFEITTAVGIKYYARAVIVACGVYLNPKIIIGKYTRNVGPNGFAGALCLTSSLEKLGLSMRRFKTGTPARINGRSINFAVLEKQAQDENMPPFSFMNDHAKPDSASCYTTYSSDETKRIILENKHLAPIYTGEVEGTGPRYCPSIEDKVVRFADKERHQIFLEPEGLDNNEWYVQGVSSSMPADVQHEIYSSIIGLERVEIMRDAYAIEYDCIDPTQLYPTLEYKNAEGLFFAGQINGTSGYEEAAGQGLVAGINAVRRIKGKELITLSRDESYIGVLIDDITSKGTNEPYRMMTGRAEHRLVLRQDNADMRLTEIGYKIGVVDSVRHMRYLQKAAEIFEIKNRLKATARYSDAVSFLGGFGEPCPPNGISYENMLKRNTITIFHIRDSFNILNGFSLRALETAENDIKYDGYIKQQQLQIEQAKKLEGRLLPDNIDYSLIQGLRLEARQKLSQIRPLNLGQASRISGVSPSDITVLIIWLSLNK